MRTQPENLSDLYSQLRQPLSAYLRRRVGDASVAEDLVQQVFVKALTTLKAGRPIGNLTGWLYQVARTTAIDHNRTRHLPNGTLNEETVPIEETDEHDQLHQQLATCLKPFAEALPKIYRDTLIATDFRGQSMRSVAAAAGLSESAIKSRVARARKLLKAKILDCCHVELRRGAFEDFHPRNKENCAGKCT